MFTEIQPKSKDFAQNQKGIKLKTKKTVKDCLGPVLNQSEALGPVCNVSDKQNCGSGVTVQSTSKVSF